MQFTEDQIAFRDTLKRFIDKEVVPIADEVDRNDRFPAELVPKFGDMGLLQLRLPEEYGGPGANLTTVCIAAEEFAKVSESIALISGQNGIAMIVPHCERTPSARSDGRCVIRPSETPYLRPSLAMREIALRVGPKPMLRSAEA